MVSKSLLLVEYFYLFIYGFLALSNSNSNTLIHSVLDQEEVDDGCDEVKHEDFKVDPTTVLSLKHRSSRKDTRAKDLVLESTTKDLKRIQALHSRIVERKTAYHFKNYRCFRTWEGALSFSSQLESLFGDSFSYCLLGRNSNVSSKLIFGEDKDLLSRPGLNFTTLVGRKEKHVDTFYYVQIKSVIVGGAYKIIKEAFAKKVKGYPVIKDFGVLDCCYNVSGVDKLEFPSFALVFGDGAVWNFPIENYFIKLESGNMFCLAILGTPCSGLTIIGNYPQQNFHIMYDTKRSRLGFAQTKSADIYHL
ncbi:hypothetical protein DH2020_022708 [Rehmannia glutinosa]|uniref:Xylanase inhibitor C-terminal domain-containing protein n=1 Tax=Rehmannia glutinosa TaxID=99300 RepID=A0ABR0W824_REHGL